MSIGQLVRVETESQTDMAKVRQVGSVRAPGGTQT